MLFLLNNIYDSQIVTIFFDRSIIHMLSFRTIEKNLSTADATHLASPISHVMLYGIDSLHSKPSVSRGDWYASCTQYNNLWV